MRKSSKLIALTLGIFVSISTYAQEAYPPPPPPPSYRPPPPGYAPRYRDPTAFRHMGLYLHADIGPGFMSSSGGGTTLSGPAGFGGFAVGASIAPGLILAADFFGGFTPSPNVSESGTVLGSSNFDLNIGGFGPQLVYYFMPSNVYVSGTLALTRLTATSSDGFDFAASDVGFGGRVAIGKEWWVSPHWGVGLAGQLYFSSNNEAGAGSTKISTWGAAVAFSATLN